MNSEHLPARPPKAPRHRKKKLDWLNYGFKRKNLSVLRVFAVQNLPLTARPPRAPGDSKKVAELRPFRLHRHADLSPVSGPPSSTIHGPSSTCNLQPATCNLQPSTFNLFPNCSSKKQLIFSSKIQPNATKVPHQAHHVSPKNFVTFVKSFVRFVVKNAINVTTIFRQRSIVNLQPATFQPSTSSRIVPRKRIQKTMRINSIAGNSPGTNSPP